MVTDRLRADLLQKILARIPPLGIPLKRPPPNSRHFPDSCKPRMEPPLRFLKDASVSFPGNTLREPPNITLATFFHSSFFPGRHPTTTFLSNDRGHSRPDSNSRNGSPPGRPPSTIPSPRFPLVNLLPRSRAVFLTLPKRIFPPGVPWASPP